MEVEHCYRACTEDGVKCVSTTYEYPILPDTVLHSVNSIQMQADVITGISTAGVGFILTILFRFRAEMSVRGGTQHGEQKFLVIPLLLFVLSVAVGLVIGAYRTGFLFEVSTGWNGSIQCYIVDARQHFRVEYYELFRWTSWSQILSSGLAILITSGCLSCHLWKQATRERSE